MNAKDAKLMKPKGLKMILKLVNTFSINTKQQHKTGSLAKSLEYKMDAQFVIELMLTWNTGLKNISI
jgi:hypothetical protein